MKGDLAGQAQKLELRDARGGTSLVSTPNITLPSHAFSDALGGDEAQVATAAPVVEYVGTGMSAGPLRQQRSFALFYSARALGVIANAH